MACVKTGCEVYLSEYNEWVRGDAFLVGPRSDTLVIRVSGRYLKTPPRKHFTVHRTEHWFDRDSDRVSTLISDVFVNHGYDGVTTLEIVE